MSNTNDLKETTTQSQLITIIRNRQTCFTLIIRREYKSEPVIARKMNGKRVRGTQHEMILDNLSWWLEKA